MGFEPSAVPRARQEARNVSCVRSLRLRSASLMLNFQYERLWLCTFVFLGRLRSGATDCNP